MPAFRDPKRRQSLMPDDLRQFGDQIESMTGPLPVVAGGVLMTPGSSMAEELRQRMAELIGTAPVTAPPRPLPPARFWPGYEKWMNFKDETRRLRDALMANPSMREVFMGRR